ncbi:MAG: hypothetical protein K6G60_05845 [Lachnospiraceae bacterium]|nr:hypothetical protein [Lachnospiraceae bacterium]
MSYSSYLKLNVLYLNKTDIATKEDIDNDLVYWAEIFKATTWEELKKICLKNDTFKEVAQVMYKSNVQSQEKTIMEAHEKYMLDKRTLEHELQESKEELALLADEKAALTAENSTLTAENSTLTAEKSTLTAENSTLTAENSTLTAENSKLSTEVSSLMVSNAKLLALLKQNGVPEEQIAAY